MKKDCSAKKKLKKKTEKKKLKKDCSATSLLNKNKKQ
jgi:hypothetical protein